MIFPTLGYRFPKIRRLIHPPSLILVKEGQMIPRNMRKEFVPREELESMLREQGVKNVVQVKEAYMEGDGKISVITKGNGRHHAPEKREQ